ncbi:helix-turn-helix domain-containing protein [Thermodesulfobacteriota bacterium]
MKSGENETSRNTHGEVAVPKTGKAEALLRTDIGASLDLLIEYLVDNRITGIHPLIMGEVEKRLIIKALESCRGNKMKAAKILGMSRNTFYKKIRKLSPEAESLGKTKNSES